MGFLRTFKYICITVPCFDLSPALQYSAPPPHLPLLLSFPCCSPSLFVSYMYAYIWIHIFIFKSGYYTWVKTGSICLSDLIWTIHFPKSATVSSFFTDYYVSLPIPLLMGLGCCDYWSNSLVCRFVPCQDWRGCSYCSPSLSLSFCFCVWQRATLDPRLTWNH